MSEWLKEHAWKVCKRLNRASGVRIPLSPPASHRPLHRQGLVVFRLRAASNGLCAIVPVGSTVIAEGVETAGDYRALRALGVPLFQGYLVGRPALEALEGMAPEAWDRLD